MVNEIVKGLFTLEIVNAKLASFPFKDPCNTVADPGFSRGGAPTLRGGGGANIQFCQIFPKTAWNWKSLDPKGVHVPHPPPPPLDPPP